MRVLRAAGLDAIEIVGEQPLQRVERARAAEPTVPRCDTSNTTACSRHARCSSSTPVYCSGISQPPNGTILRAERAVLRVERAEAELGVVGLDVGCSRTRRRRLASRRRQPRSRPRRTATARAPPHRAGLDELRRHARARTSRAGAGSRAGTAPGSCTSGYCSRSRRALRFFFVTSFWFSVVISM